MKALVLAAGYATRLYPLTRERAKPLLDVGGQPIITRIVARIASAGAFDETVVVTNARFFAQFSDWAENLSKSAGLAMPVRVVNDGTRSEADRLGAIGDMQLAIAASESPDDGWLVVAGDNILAFDFSPLVARYLAYKAPMLIVRDVELPLAPSPYSEVTVDDVGQVVGFREKPAQHATGKSAIAMYFLPPDIERLIAAYLSGGGNPDAPGHFLEWLVPRTRVRAEAMPGLWLDIGTPETLEHARAVLSSRSDCEP